MTFKEALGFKKDLFNRRYPLALFLSLSFFELLFLLVLLVVIFSELIHGKFNTAGSSIFSQESVDNIVFLYSNRFRIIFNGVLSDALYVGLLTAFFYFRSRWSVHLVLLSYLLFLQLPLVLYEYHFNLPNYGVLLEKLVTVALNIELSQYFLMKTNDRIKGLFLGSLIAGLIIGSFLLFTKFYYHRYGHRDFYTIPIKFIVAGIFWLGLKITQRIFKLDAEVSSDNATVDPEN